MEKIHIDSNSLKDECKKDKELFFSIVKRIVLAISVISNQLKLMTYLVP